MALALVVLGLAAAQPQARAGYPKLYRCQSAIERPVALPGYSAACLRFREEELAAIRALPLRQRRARVTRLREAMGLLPGEGLELAPDGSLGVFGDRRR